MEPFREQKK
jgi:hypothetical protein